MCDFTMSKTIELWIAEPGETEEELRSEGGACGGVHSAMDDMICLSRQLSYFKRLGSRETELRWDAS